MARIAAANSKKRKLQTKTMSFGFGAKKAVAKIFNTADSDDEEDGRASTAAEGKGSNSGTRTAGLSAARKEEIDKTAQWLNNNPENEAVILEKSKGNPKFAFLFNAASEEGRYYEEVQTQLKLQAEVKAVCEGAGGQTAAAIPMQAQEVAMQGQPNQIAYGSFAPQAGSSAVGGGAAMSVGLAAAQAMAQALAGGAAAAAPVPAAATPVVAADGTRKNRWGPPVQVALPLPAGPRPPSSKPPARPGVAGGSGPVDHAAALPETMDEAALKQLRDQKQMQLLQQRALEAARAQASAGGGQSREERLHEERLREYEVFTKGQGEKGLGEVEKDTIEDAEYTGGVIDGGTWEHRKRAKEMLATADVALGLTLGAQGKGAHAAADYLPKEELDSFLGAAGKAGGAGEKTAPLPTSFDRNKLDGSNLGYQMLAKAGWHEGAGLGADATGMVAPVSVKPAAMGDAAGLGAGTEDETAGGDDEFDSCVRVTPFFSWQISNL